MKHIKVATKVKPVKAVAQGWQEKLDEMVCRVKGDDKEKCDL